MSFISCFASSSKASLPYSNAWFSGMRNRALRSIPSGAVPTPRYGNRSTNRATYRFNATQATQSNGDEDASAPSDPLHPGVPLSDFQLPLHPLPPPIPHIAPSDAITRPVLHRLHRLSALNPPAADSQEEKELMEELNGLVGLMDLVKAVELPADLDLADLLSEGKGQIIVDGSHLQTTETGEDRAAKLAREAKDAEKGRQLLGYATNTTGEYYSSRSNRKTSA